MPKRDIMIKPAGPGDLQALLELYRHLNPDDPAIDPAWASDRFSTILAQPGMTIFVALAADMPAASRYADHHTQSHAKRCFIRSRSRMSSRTPITAGRVMLAR